MSKRYLSTDEKRAQVAADIQRTALQYERLGAIALFSLLPSNMAAGPCGQCLKVAGTRYSPEEAPLPPFDECPHPDQCGCFYRLDPPEFD
jgi:hypothetical protein